MGEKYKINKKHATHCHPVEFDTIDEAVRHFLEYVHSSQWPATLIVDELRTIEVSDLDSDLVEKFYQQAMRFFYDRSGGGDVKQRHLEMKRATSDYVFAILDLYKPTKCVPCKSHEISVPGAARESGINWVDEVWERIEELEGSDA